jgi:hypothetical protein
MKTIPQEALLREHLVASSGWVREQLRRADLGCNFSLEIKIEGPIQTGDAKLTYKLDHTKNYDSSVSGNSLAEVTWELLRRSGWNEQHRGLLLEWNGAAAPSLAGE